MSIRRWIKWHDGVVQCYGLGGASGCWAWQHGSCLQRSDARVCYKLRGTPDPARKHSLIRPALDSLALHTARSLKLSVRDLSDEVVPGVDCHR